MSERFFVASPISGPTAVLATEEARHLTSVMRAKRGDRVTVFDGSGSEFFAEVAVVAKHSVELAIIERREVSRELPLELTLAVALPKGERQKWLVEKVTELGVTRLVPLVTERGVAQPVESALERLRRSVIEASKQCGRNRLMEIGEPRNASELLATSAAGCSRLIADPSGGPLEAGLFTSGTGLIAAIGPEGGFSGAELQAATAGGWQRVSLGASILRVETAAIAVAAWAALRPHG